MSNYTVKYIENADVIISNKATLDPADYVDCDSLRDLKDALIDELCYNVDIGSNVDIQDSYDIRVDIPDEFIQEWRKLKGYDE